MLAELEEMQPPPAAFDMSRSGSRAGGERAKGILEPMMANATAADAMLPGAQGIASMPAVMTARRETLDESSPFTASQQVYARI